MIAMIAFVLLACFIHCARISESRIWGLLETEKKDRSDVVHLITGDFYDTYLVERLTSTQKVPSEQWVIGLTTMSTDEPEMSIARSIYEASQSNSLKPNLRFGLIDLASNNPEDNRTFRETLSPQSPSAILILTQGRIWPLRKHD